MARRVTLSQFKSMVRQQQQKQRQAVDKLNREIRSYNQKVTRVVNAHNQQVRAHNARVRANQQRLSREIVRLNQQATSPRYATFEVSVRSVHSAYERLENAASAGKLDDRYNEVLDLSEREAANNAGLMNSLLGGTQPDVSASASQEDFMAARLQLVSPEIADRWRGALFSLNPQNPDAARHFCTSAREIITQILDLKAPNNAVALAVPDYDRTQQGIPTRRAKISYLLSRAGHVVSELEDFVENDMNNIVELFRVFNDGTHGSAGTFDFPQLHAIRSRVEHGIEFLLKVIN